MKYPRTTNRIESNLGAVRLPTHALRVLVPELRMVFTLGLEAQKHGARLHGFELIPKVVTGVRFVGREGQNQQAA